MDNKDAYIKHLENKMVNLNETINGLQNQIDQVTRSAGEINLDSAFLLKIL